MLIFFTSFLISNSSSHCLYDSEKKRISETTLKAYPLELFLISPIATLL